MRPRFHRIAILDRGAAALRAIQAVREYAWQHGIELHAVAVHAREDAGALFVRAADDAVAAAPGHLAEALAAARVDALWASWDPIVPHAEAAALCTRLQLVNIGAPPAVVQRLADPAVLASIAAAAGVDQVERRADAAPTRRFDVLADGHGTLWLLGPRQALLTQHGAPMLEALAPHQEAGEWEALCTVLARAAKFAGAGTIELAGESARDAGLVGFVPYLQLGHALSEVATGLDLMKAQLDLAAGARLAAAPPHAGTDALAAHLAADASAGAASRDRLELLRLPSGVGLRVDAGGAAGDAIPPTIATLVARGQDRGETAARLRRALADTTVVLARGVPNKARLLRALDDAAAGSAPEHADVALLRTAIALYDDEAAAAQARFSAAAVRGRPRVPHEVGRPVAVRHRNHTYGLHVYRLGPEQYRIDVDGQRLEVELQRHADDDGRLRLGSGSHRVFAHPRSDEFWIEVDGMPHRVASADGGLVRAPAPAVVLSVSVQSGDPVAVGDRLLVLEAMKTEMPVVARFDGRVADVLVRANTQVDAGAPLLRFDPPAADGVAEGARVRFAAVGALAPPAASQPAHILAALQALALGFDVDPAETTRLLGAYADACGAVPPDDCALLAGEEAWLATFADVQILFRRRNDEADDDDGGTGTEEYLFSYLRAPARAEERLPASFIDKLRRAVAHYGVRDLTLTPALEQSLFRLCLAHERLGHMLTVARAILERRLAQHATLAARSSAGWRALLDRLVTLSQARDPGLCELAREVRYRYFDARLFAAARERAYHQAEANLNGLTDDPGARAAHIAALIDCPQPLVGRVTRRLAAAAAPQRRALLEVLTRRYYRIRDLRGFECLEVRDQRAAAGAEATWSYATAHYLLEGQRIRVIALYSSETDLAPALAALRPPIAAVPAADEIVLDLYVGAAGPAADVDPDSVAARLGALLGAAELRRPIRRVVVARVSSDVGDSIARVQHFTFRPADGGYGEDVVYRGIHPLMGKRLHLWRLTNFTFERLPSVEDVYLFRAFARTNPKDERLFAIAEVRDLTPVRDASGRVVELPHLERMLHEALAGLRRLQAGRPARQRLYWNRVLLYVWPPLDLARGELDAIIRKLSPATDGLGLEQVVIRTQMPDPADGVLRDAVLRISNPSGGALVITTEPPPDHPLQPMTEYEQQVVRMRQRGLVYPYELIRMLTPAVARAAGDFPAGSFTEYDLDAGGNLVPVDRPFGQNTANLVVGVIRNVTPRYPDGMTRVMILGDPSRAMGSVAEPECRRIDAALDLAEQLGVPTEWFALCSGAKIAMDSGTENMDWCARTIRRIVEYTQAGGELNVIVYGINVGAQSYWNAEATMLMHTRGLLVMTAAGAMVLTGKRALDYSGGVSAEDNLGIGGYERVMGPNGQAQYWAADLTAACHLLLRHYEHTYVAPGERFPRRAPTQDPFDRDIGAFPHGRVDGIDFATVGDVLSSAHNPGRKKPFDIRRVLHAAIDQDCPPLERWTDMRDAESAVVWDARIGGFPVCLIGVESRPLPRFGPVPADGPRHWTPGTLFPLASKKVARAVNAASGNRPVVVLANLSGFDGSPESMRELQLEYGAEIGRAVVNFRGPFVFCVISRYHGGAYVVFSKVLNDQIESAALEGSYASVIGGAPAAAVVFAAEVEARTKTDPRLQALDRELAAAADPERCRRRAERDDLYAAIHSEKLGEMAEQFDRVHSVYRAQQTGSLDHIIPPSRLRPYLIEALERGVRRHEAQHPPRRSSSTTGAP